MATTVLLVVSAFAQAGKDGGMDVRNVCLGLADGKLTGSFEYSLVVGTFFEWNTDPTAVPGLMGEVTRRTGIRAKVNFRPIALDDRRIARNPFLILTGNRFFHLTEGEIANLQRYLQQGGFLYADDCGGADRSFRIMIQKLLPDSKLAELKPDHPLFQSFYKLKGTPKILDLYHGKAKGYGVHIGDRLAVFYTYDTDVPCGWEKNPDGTYVHLLNKDKHERSYRLGVNVVMYALRELYQRKLAGAPLAATRPVAIRPGKDIFLAGKLQRERMKLRMPCNLIRAIAPAGRYVWLAGRRTMPGEQEGIARYDYETDRWELFLDSEGVLADEINCLAAGSDGLWIGTSTIRRRWNYGLWHYSPKARRSRRYTKDEGLVDHDVYDLAADGDNLYVATRSGLARLDRKTGKWTKDPTHSRNYLDLTLCLAVDERYVWAGRSGGLRRFDKRDKTYSQFNSANSPIDGMVNALAREGGRLWISAPPKLITFQGGKFTTPEVPRALGAAEVLAAAADEKILCFGTRSAGLFVRDKATRKWRVFNKASGLPTNCISRIALDSRSIWVAFGQAPLGVGRFDRNRRRWRFHTHRAGIPCNHIYCLVADGKAVYVGTMANGFWKYDVSSGRWINLNIAHRAEHALLRRADVYCLALDKEHLWFGSNLRLCRHRLGTDTYEIIPGLTAAVTALARLDGQILCGTQQRGLMAFDPAKKTWDDLNESYGLEPRPVTALACDADHIWLGTEEGLLLVGRKARKPLPLPSRLSKATITALMLRGRSAFIGTSAGLFRYDPDSHDLAATPLTSEHITAILVVPRGVIVGTRTGLAFLPAGQENPVFDKRLADHFVSGLAADRKHLWIGTLGQGLIRTSE